MPKTAMHKNDYFAPHEGNVRFAGNIRAMQAIATVPQFATYLPDSDFG